MLTQTKTGWYAIGQILYSRGLLEPARLKAFLAENHLLIAGDVAGIAGRCHMSDASIKDGKTAPFGSCLVPFCLRKVSDYGGVRRHCGGDV